MTQPFSIGYSDHHSATVYEELRNAWNQRRWALGQPLQEWNDVLNCWQDGNTPISDGTMVQSIEFYSTIQLWIYNNCKWFLDPANDDYSGMDYIRNIGELNEEAGEYNHPFEYFCREIVGGTLVNDGALEYGQYGFREEWDERCYGFAFHLFADGLGWDLPFIARSDMFLGLGKRPEYGNIIAGGINSGWCIYDDICACLSKMRATKIRQIEASELANEFAATIIPKTDESVHWEGYEFNTCRNGANVYNASEQTLDGINYPLSMVYLTGGYKDYLECTNMKIDYYVPPSMSTYVHSHKLYYKTKKHSYLTGGYGHFDDFGMGLEEDKYAAIADLDYSTSGIVTSPALLTLDPASACPFDFGVQTNGAGFERYAEEGISDLIGVALWNFTCGEAWS